MDSASTTADICSYARAHHSIHGSRHVFDDYLAFELMGLDAYESAESLLACKVCPSGNLKGSACPWINRNLSPILLSRSAFAERSLQVFAERHPTCQYVICGAGMDTFAFRNGNPGIKVFEIDHPLTQGRKMERLASLGWDIPDNVRFVSADLTSQSLSEVLLGAGFDVSVPTFFSVLGLTYYISLADLEMILVAVSQVAPVGSQVVFDFPDETTPHADSGEGWLLARLAAGLGEPMHAGLRPSDIREASERCGFVEVVHLPPERIQALFFDGRRDGQSAIGNVHLMRIELVGGRAGEAGQHDTL